MKCIALECGLQNGTLAIFVSTQIFGADILYVTPTAAYGLIMYITGFIFVFLLRRSSWNYNLVANSCTKFTKSI